MEMMVYHLKSSRFGSSVLVERVSLRVCLASLSKLKIWMEVWFGIRRIRKSTSTGLPNVLRADVVGSISKCFENSNGDSDVERTGRPVNFWFRCVEIS